jgi:hypothetical protein
MPKVSLPHSVFLGGACVSGSLASALALPCYGNRTSCRRPVHHAVLPKRIHIESTLSARCNTSVFSFHHYHSASPMRNLRHHHVRG